MFSTYSSRVAELLQKIESGEIALPDLQRPFVWEDAKVRNLLDSMNKGFPVGYVMLWDFPDDYDAKPRSSAIAKSGTRSVRSLLIDGQQRLTALLSAMDGIVVKDKDYRDRRIRISFNPLAKADDGKQIGQFEVWTSATEKDPEWVSDITEVYKLAAENPTTGVFMFCQAYYSAVNASHEKKGLALLTTEEQAVVYNNINKLLGLRNYNLPVVSIDRTASEEDVAEIFVRVNSGGQKLLEKNFIETLLAVYDNDIHWKISQFCESARVPKDKSAYNHIIKPEPSHLIRAAVALGFDRARLKYSPEYTESQLTDEDFLKKEIKRLGADEQIDPTLGSLQMALFDETVEKKLIKPTFIIDYPTEISPLARASDVNPDITERFELFIAGRETANGFSELNDPDDQAARFRAQVERKGHGDDEAMYYDADYVTALEYGLPPTAGCGIGIDRFMMLLTDAPTIRDVLLFPALRPESKN